LGISKLIVGHRVEEHAMKRRKTMGMLEKITISQVLTLELFAAPPLPNVLNLEKET